MERIKVFISYSSAQKTIGGKFKECLIQYCGYDTFIAHSDIPPSTVWEEEIVTAIKGADFFIPLISDEFKSSDFTDQETGIAVCLKKKIIPVKLGSQNPYGFINKYQALQYKEYSPGHYYKNNIKELVLTIAQIGLKYKLDSIYHKKSIHSLVYAFCNSGSFENTNAIIELMCTYDHFNEELLEKISDAIKVNGEIQGAFSLNKLKHFLQKTYNITVD